MDITAITPTQLSLAIAASSPVPSGNSPVKPQIAGNSNDLISLGVPVSEKTGKIGNLNDGSNSLALGVKETDQKLSVLADSINKMKGTVETIVKNFPPFSPDSSARKELLMSYASIRKELLQLTLPVPPQPVYEKIQHQWQDLFQKDAPANTIKLPGEIGSTTSVSDLKATIADLATLHDGVTSVRTDLKQSLLAK